MQLICCNLIMHLVMCSLWASSLAICRSEIMPGIVMQMQLHSPSPMPFGSLCSCPKANVVFLPTGLSKQLIIVQLVFVPRVQLSKGKM